MFSISSIVKFPSQDFNNNSLHFSTILKKKYEEDENNDEILMKINFVITDSTSHNIGCKRKI